MSIVKHAQRLVDLQSRPRGPGADAPQARLILETRDNPDLEAARSRVATALPGVDFRLAPLFRATGGKLARFFTLVLPRGEHAAPGESPFELAHDLLDALELASAEPLLDAAGAEPHSVDELPRNDGPGAASFGDGGGSSGGGSSGSSDPGNAGPVPDDAEWHLKSLRAPEAWQFSRDQGRPADGRGIVVAQPDTGVAEHNLLIDAIDWERGANVSEPGTPPVDPLDYKGNPGHGTSAAGVAASRGGGAGRRVRGVAPAAMVAPMRAVNTVIISPNNSDYVARAVEEAIRRGAHVVSMSLGGLYYVAPKALAAAIESAVRSDLIVIVAAGNVNLTSRVTYPGWDPNAIAVAGSTPSDEPWTGSCRGSAVAVTAPGANIQVAWRTAPSDPVDKIGAGSGTSWATAGVAGVAALWLAHHGRDNLIQRYGTGQLHHRFRALLGATARRPAGWDTSNWGTGIVDAGKLLKVDLALPLATEVAALDEPALRREARSALRDLGIDGATAAALAEVDLDRYGNEILYLSRGPAGPTEEAAGSAPRRPRLSGQLASALDRARAR
jgi:hypothetical protein